jgi:hypothetical protein
MRSEFLKNVSADEKHVLYGVRIIVERQPIDNIWKPHRWVIHDLLPLDRVSGDGTPPINDIPLVALRGNDDELSMLFTAEASLDMHRAEAEAYAENLASSDPAIYLVLRKNENSDDYDDIDDDDADGRPEIHVAEVSLSPYNIQDYEDCGEDQIEKLPLQGPIAEFVEEFVKIHFQPEPFKKRQRDKSHVALRDAGRGDVRTEQEGDVFSTPTHRRGYQ